MPRHLVNILDHVDNPRSLTLQPTDHLAVEFHERPDGAVSVLVRGTSGAFHIAFDLDASAVAKVRAFLRAIEEQHQ